MNHMGRLGDMDRDIGDMHEVSDISEVGMTDIAYFFLWRGGKYVQSWGMP